MEDKKRDETSQDVTKKKNNGFNINQIETKKEDDNEDYLERKAKAHKTAPNSTPNSSRSAMVSSSTILPPPPPPSSFQSSTNGGEKGLLSNNNSKFSLGGNTGGGTSGQWSGLLSQQLSGSFGPSGLSGLLNSQSSGTFGSGGLSGLLNSKQNNSSKLQETNSVNNIHGNFKLNQLGGSSQSFGSLSSLLHSNSSNTFTSAGSMDFSAKRILPLNTQTSPVGSTNVSNNIIGPIKEEVSSKEMNGCGDQKNKRNNPSHLKIKTRTIPEEPMEEREIEAEFERMRMIMRERGLEFKPDPDASLPENSPKNRYFDVLPNKGTSVKIAAGSKSTYINANYVSDPNLEGNSQKYICCQAPLTNTFADFWTMIWEKNCPVIVMLTRLEERNLVKADVYWPEEGTSRLYGGIMVNHKKTKILKKTPSNNTKKNFFGGLFQRKEKTEAPVDPFSSSIFKMPIAAFNSHASFGGFSLFEPGASLSSFGSMANLHAPFSKISSVTSTSKEIENSNTIVIRKFLLYDVRDPARTTRELIQLHYTEWPDYGIPDSTDQMSDLIRELDIRKKGLDDPIVVHCSAGIGRTGTFLAIHMALQQVALGLKPSVDVFETVINLRSQRNGMVQSKDQYKFVYVTIKDMLMDKYNKYNSVSKSRRNDLLNKTQTKMDHVRSFIEKAPRNRPTRSASEPIIENLWKKLIEDDEFPQRMDEVRKKLSNTQMKSSVP